MVSPVAMAGTVGGRLSHLNLFPAEKFPDHGHFEFQRHRETGHFFTRLDDLADDRQIERRQQVSRFTVDESGCGRGLPAFVLGRSRSRSARRSPSTERSARSAGESSQAGNIGCPILCGPNKRGNFASQLGVQFACSIRDSSCVFAAVFIVFVSFSLPKIAAWLRVHQRSFT